MDIGCGTGYVAHLVLARRPGLRFVGVDLKADAMRAAADNLAGTGAETTFVEGDLMAPRDIDVPRGPYRAIWTALTFHDLSDEAKQAVIGWAAERLAAPGYLYIYDRVRLTEPSLFPLQQSIWARIERVHGTGKRTAVIRVAVVFQSRPAGE